RGPGGGRAWTARRWDSACSRTLSVILPTRSSTTVGSSLSAIGQKIEPEENTIAPDDGLRSITCDNEGTPSALTIALWITGVASGGVGSSGKTRSYSYPNNPGSRSPVFRPVPWNNQWFGSPTNSGKGTNSQLSYIEPNSRLSGLALG